MSKHTPGPWSVSGNEIQAPWGEAIAFMAAVDGDVLDEQKANARLIVTSTDLLEECKAQNEMLSQVMEWAVAQSAEQGGNLQNYSRVVGHNHLCSSRHP